jgi:hypothetical protein
MMSGEQRPLTDGPHPGSESRFGSGASRAVPAPAFVLIALAAAAIETFWSGSLAIGAIGLLPLAILAQIPRFATTLRRQDAGRVLVHQTTALTMTFVFVISGVGLGDATLAAAAPKVSSTATASSTSAAPWEQAGSTQWPPAPDDAQRHLLALKSAVEEIPSDSFDPRALVASAGTDPSRLFEWVRDNTYWVPYRGALRGPVGVVMDRLGNSLDRALLLAELLRLAGHNVRLARKTLPDSETATLRPKLRAVPQQRLPVGAARTPAQAGDGLDRYATQFKLDAAAARETASRLSLQWKQVTDELGQRVPAQSAFLNSSVGRPATAAADGVVAALADHWWVERLEQGSWLALDPLLPDARPGDARSAPEETFPYARRDGIIPLPDKFCHKLTFRVVVEQWRAGAVVEKTALRYSFRPAETIGQPMSFGHVSLHALSPAKLIAEADRMRAFKAMVVNETEWLPSLTVGARTITQSSFTDKGNVNATPGSDAPSKGGLAGGFGGLMGGEPENAKPVDGQLTAEWIEYEISAPGKNPIRVRRDVFDLLGPGARAAKPIADPGPGEPQRLLRGLHLGESFEVLPLACSLSIPFVARQIGLGMLGNQKALVAMFEASARTDVEGMFVQSAKLKPVGGRLFDLAVARFQWGPAAGDVYIDSLNLLSYRSGASLDAAGGLFLRQGYDIVLNDVGVREASKLDPFQTRLAQGTADTNAEALLIDDASVVNAGALLKAAANPRQSWAAIRGAQDPALSRLNWPTEVRARIDKELGSGYVVVVPTDVAKSRAASDYVWWRIDPKSGQTIGTGALGWGQGLTETVKTGYVAISTLVIFFGGTDYCLSEGLSAKECLCYAAAGGIGGGASIGGALGMAVGPLLTAVVLITIVAGFVIGVKCMKPTKPGDSKTSHPPALEPGR